MKYTLNWLIELEKEEHKRIKYLFFWGHQKTKNGELSSSCFSQWWDSPFNVDNVKYKYLPKFNFKKIILTIIL
jgi:predicted NAD-dependent protein-ADP-ribosyltransferase YbiA (DUF1768 family)